MQSARRDASRPGAAEALFLKSLVPALLILAPWELGKISLRGLLSPSNLPKALASRSTCVWSGNKQREGHRIPGLVAAWAGAS